MKRTPDKGKTVIFSNAEGERKGIYQREKLGNHYVFESHDCDSALQCKTVRFLDEQDEVIFIFDQGVLRAVFPQMRYDILDHPGGLVNSYTVGNCGQPEPFKVKRLLEKQKNDIRIAKGLEFAPLKAELEDSGFTLHIINLSMQSRGTNK